MIRILRIIEYTYASNEAAEADMAHWQLPPVGARRRGTTVLRSTIIEDLNFEYPTEIVDVTVNGEL